MKILNKGKNSSRSNNSFPKFYLGVKRLFTKWRLSFKIPEDKMGFTMGMMSPLL